MKFAALLLVAGFFASTVNAGAQVGNPFSTTVWNANADEQVIIRDDGKSTPAFKTLTCAVDLMTGNDQQIKVDSIDKGVKLNADPTTVKYKVRANLGPPGKFYFIRLTCDPNKFISFSARFTINGIKGTVTGLDPNAPVKDPAATTPSPNDATGNNSTSSQGGFSTGPTPSQSGSNSGSSPTTTASGANPSKTASSSARIVSSTLLSAGLGFIGLAFAYIC